MLLNEKLPKFTSTKGASRRYVVGSIQGNKHRHGSVWREISLKSTSQRYFKRRDTDGISDCSFSAITRLTAEEGSERARGCRL
jgi:hypothetical protein